MAKMKPNVVEMVNLFYKEGCSCREIAKITGKPWRQWLRIYSAREPPIACPERTFCAAAESARSDLPCGTRRARRARSVSARCGYGSSSKPDPRTHGRHRPSERDRRCCLEVWDRSEYRGSRRRS